MTDEDIGLDEIVTEFIMKTTRLHPKISRHAAFETRNSCGFLRITSSLGAAKELVTPPVTTGSAAEFYIEPMLPHVGDIDVMYHNGNRLAILRGHPPPTQLPDEFDVYVEVFEIIDSHLPGYVYLKWRYSLTESAEDGKYYSRPAEHSRLYLSNNVTVDNQTSTHGPAVLTDNSDVSQLSIDAVFCIRCLSWPPQATDWPTRQRNYDWPDSATVDRVVANGCDVVRKAHHQCKQHKLMGSVQWRLSFSRAEILLLNSWMPVQQIVYHMLRVFLKTQQLTDGVDNSVAGTLSNYHIKTLMLWACELKPGSWWTDHLCLVRICVYLLHTLGNWLIDTRCSQYFISNCNLIDNTFDVKETTNQLMTITEEHLSAWFVNNYIQKCCQQYQISVSLLSGDVSTRMKLRHAVSAIIDWRVSRSTELSDLWHRLGKFELEIESFVYNESLDVRTCTYLMTELTKFDACLSVYFIAVAFLHIACKLERNGCINELMDVIATIVGQYVDKPSAGKPIWIVLHQYSSVSSLNSATKLMKKVANKSHSTVRLIEIELAKVYLYRALKYKDSDSDSIYCLAHVYLAALYYTTGQYQIAIDHCTVIMRSQDHSQCSSHVVEGELLLKIDDDIDNMLGLAVFYQHIRAAALSPEHKASQCHVNVCTTEIFAHFLFTVCVSVTMCPVFRERSITHYCSLMNYRYIHRPMLTDLLLLKTIQRRSVEFSSNCQYKSVMRNCSQRMVMPSVMDMTDLCELLKRSAVEHMTHLLFLKVQEFAPKTTIVTTVYEALYAYKYGQYKQCLQLSTQNVETLLFSASVSDFTTYPEFIQLLDDDIVSLTALTLIVDPKCRRYGSNVCITQLTLSLYLMAQCRLQLHHSLTSLTQTLDYIEVAKQRLTIGSTLDELTLKLIECKLLRHTGRKYTDRHVLTYQYTDSHTNQDNIVFVVNADQFSKFSLTDLLANFKIYN